MLLAVVTASLLLEYVGLRAQWAPTFSERRLGPEAALPTFELSVSIRRLRLNRRPGDRQQLQKLGLGTPATLSWMTSRDSTRDRNCRGDRGAADSPKVSLFTPCSGRDVRALATTGDTPKCPARQLHLYHLPSSHRYASMNHHKKKDLCGLSDIGCIVQHQVTATRGHRILIQHIKRLSSLRTHVHQIGLS